MVIACTYITIAFQMQIFPNTNERVNVRGVTIDSRNLETLTYCIFSFKCSHSRSMKRFLSRMCEAVNTPELNPGYIPGPKLSWPDKYKPGISVAALSLADSKGSSNLWGLAFMP